MQALRLGRLAAGAAAGALLLAGTTAFAQTYDTGAPGSGSAGSIVPTPGNLNTPGITNPGGVSAGTAASGTAANSGTPGIPNTGGMGSSAPGIPNTGAGGEAAQNLALAALSAAVAAGGALYLARRKFAR